MAAISGLIDIVVNVINAARAAEKHDWTGVAAFAISATGASIGTVGLVGSALSKMPAGPFVIAGLVLMGIGAIISLFRDTLLDTFLKFCAFGKDGGGGTFVEGLEEMKKGDYGQQLEVLINLICSFKMTQLPIPMNPVEAKTVDERRTRFTMGWIPDGAKLVVDYRDDWWLGPRHYETIEPGHEASGLTKQVSKTYEFGKGGERLNKDREFECGVSGDRCGLAHSRV